MNFESLNKVSPSERRDCIETLIKIFRNIKLDSENLKYRTIPLTNKKFLNDVWRHLSGRDFLLKAGWQKNEASSSISLPKTADINYPLEALLEERLKKPLEEQKQMECVFITGEKEREEELKAKALKQKAIEIEAFKKDQAERKAIAATIAAEKEAKRREKILYPSQPQPKKKPQTPIKPRQTTIQPHPLEKNMMNADFQNQLKSVTPGNTLKSPNDACAQTSSDTREMTCVYIRSDSKISEQQLARDEMEKKEREARIKEIQKKRIEDKIVRQRVLDQHKEDREAVSRRVIKTTKSPLPASKKAKKKTPGNSTSGTPLV